MRPVTKVTSIIAGVGAAALGVGLIGYGTGVGANFYDTVTAHANVSVGTLNCDLSSTSAAVSISGSSSGIDKHDIATVNVAQINTSTPGSATEPITVNNIGTMPVVVNWATSTSGNIFDSNRVSAVSPAQNNEIDPGGSSTYMLGVEWPTELENADEGTSGSVTYTATCSEVAGRTRSGNLLFKNQGGSITTNSDGSITLDRSSGNPFVGLEGFGSHLPAQQPSLTVADVTHAPYWYVRFADGSYLHGYLQSNGTWMWLSNNSAATWSGWLTTANAWSTVQNELGAQKIASVGLLYDGDNGGPNVTLACVNYGGESYVGTGACQY